MSTPARTTPGVDRTLPNERNRVHTANRYFKRIKYGNRSSRLMRARPGGCASGCSRSSSTTTRAITRRSISTRTWPKPNNTGSYGRAAAAAHTGRSVPTRSPHYRAGFEVRTYRRCHRVLMFHTSKSSDDEPCLVRSTEFDYEDLDYSLPVPIEHGAGHQGSTRFASFIRSVTQSGFVRDESQPVIVHNGVTYVTYLKKSLPRSSSSTARRDPGRDPRLDADSLENLPVGLDGAAYQWVDLDGEGVSGILTEQAGAWFYKPNLGDGRFGPLETGRRQALAGQPGRRAPAAARSRRRRPARPRRALRPDPRLLRAQRTRSERRGKPFRPFARLPNIAWDEPNLRFVDLNGDGHADVLITEHDAFTWYPSLAEDGFGPADTSSAAGRGARPAARLRRRHAVDLPRRHVRRRPHRPRAHPQRRGVLLAEPGLRPLRAQGHDGQCAVVRPPDQFDQQRIRLADIDGSGTNDIIYLGRDGVRLYFNQSGNRWSEPRRCRTAFRTSTISLGHGGRPARQRHRLPGLVVAAYPAMRAGRCATST